jgi:hypothetical protein
MHAKYPRSLAALRGNGGLSHDDLQQNFLTLPQSVTQRTQPLPPTRGARQRLVIDCHILLLRGIGGWLRPVRHKEAYDARARGLNRGSRLTSHAGGIDSYTGWIQSVVATPSRRGLRCRRKDRGVQVEPGESSCCARPAGPRWHSLRSGDGSGSRSQWGAPVRTPRSPSECRPPWADDGSGRLAGCHPHTLRRHRRHGQGGTCRSRNARHGRSRARRARACARSPVAWRARRRAPRVYGRLLRQTLAGPRRAVATLRRGSASGVFNERNERRAYASGSGTASVGLAVPRGDSQS